LVLTEPTTRQNAGKFAMAVVLPGGVNDPAGTDCTEMIVVDGMDALARRSHVFGAATAECTRLFVAKTTTPDSPTSNVLRIFIYFLLFSMQARRGPTAPVGICAFCLLRTFVFWSRLDRKQAY
jgi:hypothetical protein